MATRFYLPGSGTSPLPALAVSSTWESSGGAFFRAPTAATKSNATLADFANTFPSTATQYMCFGQWVSAPINAYTFTVTDTWAFVVRCVEGNSGVDATASISLRVVSGNGGTVRGTIVQTYTGGEFPTIAATRKGEYTGAAVSAQTGDRIVIELGARGLTPSIDYTATMRFGDPSATEDFALTSGLTTDLCPWVELSPTLTFTGGSSYTGTGGVQADASLAGTATYFGLNQYVSHLENLAPTTVYFVRAYATSSVGTAYGNELQFSALWAPLGGLGEAHADGSLAGTGTYKPPSGSSSGAVAANASLAGVGSYTLPLGYGVPSVLAVGGVWTEA